MCVVTVTILQINLSNPLSGVPDVLPLIIITIYTIGYLGAGYHVWPGLLWESSSGLQVTEDRLTLERTSFSETLGFGKKINILGIPCFPVSPAPGLEVDSLG